MATKRQDTQWKRLYTYIYYILNVKYPRVQVVSKNIVLVQTSRSQVMVGANFDSDGTSIMTGALHEVFTIRERESSYV